MTADSDSTTNINRSGGARVMGRSIIHESMAVKQSIGAVPQEIALYADLTARENLNFWGKMHELRGTILRQQVAEVCCQRLVVIHHLQE